jgi:hypothetical protein
MARADTEPTASGIAIVGGGICGLSPALNLHMTGTVRRTRPESMLRAHVNP